MGIPLFYNADKLASGLPRSSCFVEWEHRRCPNLVIIGKSGVGKSVCAQLMLGRVRRHAPGGAVATIADYKNEYGYLCGCPRHFPHDHCMDALKAFQAENERRIREGTTEEDPLHILLFSEFAMALAVQDKRTREEAISTTATLIMSVRAQRMSVWLDLQRPDSQWMGTARDSLSPIALGNLSPEGKRMAFPDFEKDLEPVGEGEGYYSDGVTLRRIVIPTVTRWDVLHEDVRALVE